MTSAAEEPIQFPFSLPSPAPLPVAARELSIPEVLTLRPRAIQGDVAAQVSLGELFHERQQFTEAVYWYRLAATNGDVTAQLGLAGCLIAGNGAPVNRREAAFWMRRAADGVERAGSGGSGTNAVKASPGLVARANPNPSTPGAIILTRSNATTTTTASASGANPPSGSAPEKNLFTNADSRSTRATRDDNLAVAEPRLQERNVGLQPSTTPK